MGLCTLLFIGAIIGALARLIVPGWQPIGFIVTVLIGVLGTVGGDFVADKADLNGVVHWLVTIGIAVVLVVIVAGAMRLGTRRRLKDER